MSAPSWRPAADRLVAALRDVFGDRLRSVVAYGPRLEEGGTAPVSCLALVTTIAVADLEACAALAQGWRRDGIATPLILPEGEFRRSLDAFPIEYAEMQAAHEVLAGTDPFTDLVIDLGDLRRACETQAKSHLVHLREGFIEAGGTPRAVSDLVTASAPAFAALLRNIARLMGGPAPQPAAAREGARLAGLPDGIVADVLFLERPSAVTVTDPAKRFSEYLAAVEQLARFVDTWRT